MTWSQKFLLFSFFIEILYVVICTNFHILPWYWSQCQAGLFMLNVNQLEVAVWQGRIEECKNPLKRSLTCIKPTNAMELDVRDWQWGIWPGCNSAGPFQLFLEEGKSSYISNRRRDPGEIFLKNLHITLKDLVKSLRWSLWSIISLDIKLEKLSHWS